MSQLATLPPIESMSEDQILQADEIVGCEDINKFCETVLIDEKGNPVKQAAVHKETNWHIDECIRQNYFALIMAPVGHGKTEQIIARVLKLIGEDKNRRISIICNTDENAAARIGSIGKYISESSQYKKICPDILPNGKWTGHQLFVKRESMSKDPSIQAWGVMSSGTGARADVEIFDDICDLKNTIINEADRPKVALSVENVWFNRLTPEGIVIYIATAIHEDDFTHRLKKNKRFKKLVIRVSDDFECLECESDFKGNYTIPLWDRINKPVLLKKLEEEGTLAFNRAFRQQAISDASRKFPHFDKCLNTELALTDVLIGGNRYVTGVDLSSESRPGNVIFTIGITAQNKKVPVDIRYGDWSSPDTAKQIREVENKYKPLVIMVENNAYQDSIIQWIKELKGEYTFWNKIKGFCTGKQKADKAIGLPSLDVEFENGSWLIPTKGHGADCQCGVCKWIAEMKSYPFGKYSDGVMASWFAREGARLFASEPFTKKELEAIYGKTSAEDTDGEEIIETTDDLMRHIA